MFEVNVESNFSAAHRLRGYKGRCENMHGHNWKVKAVVGSQNLDKQGMVMDFTILKKAMNKILTRLDHKVLNDLEYFKKVNPTSENIAKYIYDELKTQRLDVERITVWETDTSCATYYK